MSIVLIVEDETAITEMVTVVLEEEGYDVLTARHGQEALELLRQNQVDVILSDRMMPILDGVRLYHEIRADPRLRSIPFILMSAARKPPVSDGLADVLFLPKPFNVQMLLTVIEQAL